MTAPRRTRVAILGGGPAGIAAAFELTATPELRERFEVTVHQPGWRLGGKGASGRDRELCDRILEHGLHIWFGFYDNAFALMQRCYEELGRPPEAPLATWDAAFKPCHDIVIYEHWKGRWIARRCFFPPNPLPPGGPAILPALENMLEKALAWLIGAGPAHEALRMAEKLLRGFEHLTDVVLKQLGKLLRLARDELWKHYVEARIDDDGLRFWFQNLDIVQAIVHGIGDDRLLERGCESIDGEEFSAWLARHGAMEMTLQYSPVIRGVYDSSFAYEDGDKNRPNMAAGTALRDAIRTLFGHRGAFFYKMQAGMGDTVFGPLYEVLHRRGVRFEFFSFVTEVRPDAAGKTVDAIDVVDQVALTRPEYEPLYDVLGLPCWPSEPLWDQLEDGEALRKTKPDFEHVADPLGRGATTLRRGEDFDEVVLAFPPDVQRTVCEPLAHVHARYSEMLGATKTVVTQAFQLWFTEPLHEGLRWHYAEDSICGSFVEPLDTWCSMSQLIPREAFPADAVGSMVYCCGVMPDAHLHDPEQADARARANTRRFLEHDATTLWPGAAAPDGAFDWSVLVDLCERSGEQRLDAQYWRANLQAAERYVLSVAGSIGARLWPHQRPFANLVLAGDWTRSGLDAGCIEGSVTSGILAARELSGGSRDITGVGGWLNADPDRAA
jgi:uncharacterized protein with NAD-binding domain and iron-sulfur cluster